jgi:hypothetical protein
MLRSGRLSGVGLQGNPKDTDKDERVDVHAVIELREHWRGGVPVDEVARWLGQSAKRIDELAESGALSVRKDGQPDGKTSAVCWLRS